MSANNVYINIRVDDLKICRARDRLEGIPKLNRNHIFVGFHFSDSWRGLTKTALFTKTGVADAAVVIEAGDTCQIPNGFMAETGMIHVSVYAGDRRTVGHAEIPVIESGYIDAGPPAPPEPLHKYVQTPTDKPVDLLREADGTFQYFARGGWHAIGGGGPGGSAFDMEFLETDWEKAAAVYRLMVPQALHRMGGNAVVRSVMRDSGSYMDEATPTSRRYVNGDIAILSDGPFTGALSIA